MLYCNFVKILAVEFIKREKSSAWKLPPNSIVLWSCDQRQQQKPTKKRRRRPKVLLLSMNRTALCLLFFLFMQNTKTKSVGMIPNIHFVSMLGFHYSLCAPRARHDRARCAVLALNEYLPSECHISFLLDYRHAVRLFALFFLRLFLIVECKNVRRVWAKHFSILEHLYFTYI